MKAPSLNDRSLNAWSRIAAWIAPCLAGATLFLGCSDRLAGGTIETTNGISARVVLPSGQPATAIKIYLLDEQDWLRKTEAGESVVLAVAETDDSGKFEFKFKDIDTNITSSLYADVENYGLLIHAVTQKLVKDEYHGTIGMSKKVSYEGTIKDTTFVAQKIFLAGSPFQATVDGNGHFIIRNVPPESYSVVILRKLQDQSMEYVVSDKVKLDEFTEGKPAVIVPDTTKAVIIEDFEDLDNRNLLGTILGGGWWDAFNDFPANNSVLLQPANAAPQNFSKAIKYGGSDERSRSLQVLYKNSDHPAAGVEPFVFMENNLGAQSVHYNLSGMDSLTVYSAGSGKLTVELVQENPANSGIAISVIASASFNLDLAWNRFSIKPGDLKIAVATFPQDPVSLKSKFEEAKLPAYTKRPTTWQEMGGMVTRIRFKGTGGTEFWLDHIRVHGIGLGDLVK